MRTLDVGWRRRSEVGFDVLIVARAVELVHVDQALAELPCVIAGLRTCLGESRVLRQRCRVALIRDDPMLARQRADLEVVVGHGVCTRPPRPEDQWTGAHAPQFGGARASGCGPLGILPRRKGRARVVRLPNYDIMPVN
jgi:hypothetical protein